MSPRLFIACCLMLVDTGAACADEPFRFPEGKHGKGELKYVSGVPVLVVAGTPEEMGEQMGVLGLKPAAKGVAVFKEVLKQEKLDLLLPLLVAFGNKQLNKYPEAYRREFEALAKAGGVDRDFLVVANTFSDLRHLAGCSSLMVAPARSATGGALMGRNWDFPPVPGVHAYSLVIVYRPEGKHPFAVVSFPGLIAAGCLSSGMNGAGLALGGNHIDRSADKAPQVSWANTPTCVVARRILEECGTIAEAEKVLRDARPAERHALTACDRAGGAVFETTAKTLVVRRGEGGLCAGTNHFVSRELAVPSFCPRLATLARAAETEQLTVADVAGQMAEVNQRAWTAHSMVFEPGPLRLHIRFGDGARSATAFPLQTVDLGKLLNP